MTRCTQLRAIRPFIKYSELARTDYLDTSLQHLINLINESDRAMRQIASLIPSDSHDDVTEVCLFVVHDKKPVNLRLAQEEDSSSGDSSHDSPVRLTFLVWSLQLFPSLPLTCPSANRII